MMYGNPITTHSRFPGTTPLRPVRGLLGKPIRSGADARDHARCSNRISVVDVSMDMSDMGPRSERVAQF